MITEIFVTQGNFIKKVNTIKVKKAMTIFGVMPPEKGLRRTRGPLWHASWHRALTESRMPLSFPIIYHLETLHV